MHSPEELQLALLMTRKLQEGIAACGFAPSGVGIDGTFTNIAAEAVCYITEVALGTWRVSLHGHIRHQRTVMGGDLVPTLAEYRLTVSHKGRSVATDWNVPSQERDTPELFKKAFQRAAREWHRQVVSLEGTASRLITNLEENPPVPVRSA